MIRSTHVGSLVRPDDLIAYMHSIDRGEAIDEAAYADCLTRSVREVVRRQREAGVDVVSDGEYGKSSWNYYVYKRLGGFELRSDAAVRMADVGREGTAADNPVVATDWARFPEFYADYFATEQGEYEEPGGTWVCTGPVTYTGQEAIGRDIANLRAAMHTEGMREWLSSGRRAGQLFSHARRRVLRFGAGGAPGDRRGPARGVPRDRRRRAPGPDRRLPFIPFMYDVLVPPGTMADYLAWAQPRIDAVNHALEGIPAEMVRYHVCWGSWNGPHTNDIALRDVLPLVMQVHAGTYLFEAANPRHEHEWRVWEDVELADDKVIAPGVISHATNVVEHPELVAERLERIARLVGPERVIGEHRLRVRSGPLPSSRPPHDPVGQAEALSDGARIASEHLAGGRTAS